VSRRPTISPFLWLSLALACAVLAHAPHLGHPRVDTNLDHDFHYRLVLDTVQGMRAGDPWPFWAFAAKYGLGEPSLFFYAPLYHRAAGVLGLILPNSWMAMQVVEIASLAMAGAFAFLLARCYAADRWALLAIPLAIFGPMLSLLHFGFNGYPWAVAFGPLAMFTWAMLKPDRGTHWINGWAMVALALVIATHTVTGLMAVICFAPLCLTAFVPRLDVRRGLRPLIAIAGGLLLSAAYLYPAMSLMRLIDAEVWRHDYTPFNAFSLPTITAHLFGMRWFAFQWPISFVAIGGCGLAIFALRREHLAIKAGLVALAATILATEISYPLWLIDTPLRSVQFPHRFTTILCVIFAPLMPIALAHLWTQRRRFMLLATAGTALLSLALAAFVIARAATRDGEIIAVAPDQLVPYQGLDEYRIKPAATRWEAFAKTGWPAECARVGVVCTPGGRTSNGMAWTIEAPQPTQLRLPLFAFPAWQIERNGTPIATARDPGTGVITVILPSGKSQIAARWSRLPEQKTGLLVTILTLLVLLGLLLRRSIGGGRPVEHHV
jgi:hypothetical protein